MISKYAAVAAVVTAILTIAPPFAEASLYSNEVLVGFGEGYQAPDGCERTHRGVDLASGAGDGVEAPLPGTVCFAGRVPASTGGSVLAVSIDTDRGRVTLSPLDTLSTEVGSPVAAGAVVGTLAPSGDPSSSVAHLHLSLRSGDLYLDPSGMLAPPGAAPADSGEPEVSTMKSPEPVHVTSSPTAMSEGVSLATQVAVSGAVGAGAPISTGLTVGSGSAASDVVSEPGPMGQGVELAPDASAQTGAASGGPGLAPAPGAATAAPLDAAKSASLDLARSTVRQVSAIGAPAYLALVAAVVCAALILSLRAFEHRINAREPVSDRLGRILQQLRTGATLRGLTSCSGETAFTVPGPSSPGEVTK